jgi:hypothetical protein
MTNEYYIEEGFAILAGPYNENSPKERVFLYNVINDLEAGNIEYKLEPSFGENGTLRGTNVLRRGMILPK